MSETLDVFVSVGDTATQQQEDFVRAVEDRLRAEGLVPHTVGRNTFSADAPLKAVINLMGKCSGAVVIALERSRFPTGFDKPGGPKESPLYDVRLATPWNQVESGMAYITEVPLLVILEKGIRTEGLLSPGYDWYVQQVAALPASLLTAEFNGCLASWKEKMTDFTSKSSESLDPGSLNVGELLRLLKPGQLWALLSGLAAVLAGAFELGHIFYPKK